jgi:hypothetical protein
MIITYWSRHPRPQNLGDVGTEPKHRDTPLYADGLQPDHTVHLREQIRQIYAMCVHTRSTV